MRRRPWRSPHAAAMAAVLAAGGCSLDTSDEPAKCEVTTPPDDGTPASLPIAVDVLPLKLGPAIHVLDTPGHYVNDHTLVRGPDGAWHLFGIYAVQPRPDGQEEVDIVHATTTEPDPSKWTDGSFSIPADPRDIALSARPDLGETHLWAPHVVQDGSDFLMVFQAGGTGDARMEAARSADLFEWQRTPREPLFTDVCVARDPMLVRIGAQWVMYYTRCDDPCHQKSGVAYRTSDDGVAWSEPALALTLTMSRPMSNSGFTESPFVFHRGNFWYLSVTAYPVDWAATFLFRSDSPFHFDDTPVARLDAHAAEWLAPDGDLEHGPLFLTHAGPGQEGVWLKAVDGL